MPNTANVVKISGPFTAIKYANAIFTMLPLQFILIANDAYNSIITLVKRFNKLGMNAFCNAYKTDVIRRNTNCKIILTNKIVNAFLNTSDSRTSVSMLKTVFQFTNWESTTITTMIIKDTPNKNMYAEETYFLPSSLSSL